MLTDVEANMRTEKNDLRSLYSKSVIKRTLVQLLETKTIDKISVAELCKECKINRGTFYNHFYDIYDVYRNVESDFFNEIRSRLDAISLYKLDTDFFVALLRFFYDSPVMARISATSVHDSELIAKVRGMIREKVIHDLEGHGVAYDSKKMEGLFGYIVGGCSYLITRWVLTRKEKDIPKVAEECSEYTRKLLSIYLENGK